MMQEMFAGKLIGHAESGFTSSRADAGTHCRRSRPASPACCRCSTSAAASSGRRCRTISAARTPITASSCSASRCTHWRRGPRSIGSEALFVLCFCVILWMYGGGFATVPAYLADMFGTQFVGAIHGRLMTAWSMAGIFGPVVVNYIREYQIADGVPRDRSTTSPCTSWRECWWRLHLQLSDQAARRPLVHEAGRSGRAAGRQRPERGGNRHGSSASEKVASTPKPCCSGPSSVSRWPGAFGRRWKARSRSSDGAHRENGDGASRIGRAVFVAPAASAKDPATEKTRGSLDNLNCSR